MLTYYYVPIGTAFHIVEFIHMTHGQIYIYERFKLNAFEANDLFRTILVRFDYILLISSFVCCVIVAHNTIIPTRLYNQS